MVPLRGDTSLLSESQTTAWRYRTGHPDWWIKITTNPAASAPAIAPFVFSFSVTKLSNSNMEKCCVADYVNTTDSLGANNLWFLFKDFWILTQLSRKSVTTHWNGLQVAAGRPVSPLQAKTRWALSPASHLKLKVSGKHFQTLPWNPSLKWAQPSGY